MTDQTPEELDALVARLWPLADHPGSEAYQAASAITALRAREALIEAAAIERAAKLLRDVADNWDCGHMASRLCDCAPYAEQWGIAADEVFALITTGARTLLDQRIAETEQAGYERGLREAKP